MPFIHSLKRFFWLLSYVGTGIAWSASASVFSFPRTHASSLFHHHILLLYLILPQISGYIVESTIRRSQSGSIYHRVFSGLVGGLIRKFVHDIIR
jgi:hypothetical protein